MPDQHFTRATQSIRLFAIPLLLLLPVLLVAAQPRPLAGAASGEFAKLRSQPAIEVPPVELPVELPGGVWRARGRARILTAEQFAVVHGAEVFLEYGLERVTMRRYGNGSTGMTTEVFEMRFPTGAYGLYTFNRRGLPPHRLEFNAGRYLVSIAMENSASAVDADALGAVQRLFATRSSLDVPPLISHLPLEKRIPESERYLVGRAGLQGIDGFSEFANSVDFTGGVEVATADYQTGDGVSSLIIIEYHTPQSASFGYDAAFNHLKNLPEPEKARRVLKRVGNYVVAAIVAGDLAAARAVVDRVKYEIRIYWEGKKFSSIPIQFRPPDPEALEEFARTANVLLRTFYGIGFMLAGSIVLGVFAGWTVFFWRKRRRRRLGMDDYFSDAGGTLRLNLDAYIFQPSEPSIKLLGKGDM